MERQTKPIALSSFKNLLGRVAHPARRVLVFALSSVLIACGGGGGGGGDDNGGSETPPAASGVQVSGTVSVEPGTAVDGDTNDPHAPVTPNNTFAQAQTLPNPVILGGFVTKIATDHAGDRFQTESDPADVYQATLTPGQAVTLHISDYNNAHPNQVDLDLYLLDADGSHTLASSVDTGSIESVTVPTGAASATYLIKVDAHAGHSNYILTIGNQDPALAVQPLRLEDSFVVGEVVTLPKQKATTSAQNLRAMEHSLGLQVAAGASGRPMLLKLETAATGARVLTAANDDGDLPVPMTPAQVEKYRTLMAVKALREHPEYAAVEPNYLRFPTAVPNDSNYPLQWHYPLIRLPEAWNISTGSASVIVAVIDTGVVAHPDLVANLIDGYDFIKSATSAGDGDGLDADPTDKGDHGFPNGSSSFHGTHVAGTIGAAGNNGQGVTGINWKTSLMPLRVCGRDGCANYDTMQAVLYAAGLANDSGRTPPKRADVINLSLGGSGGSQAEQDVYRRAREAGVIIVAAAGNTGDSVPQFPASYDGVVSVSAVDINKQLTRYSSTGPKVDVAAPGGDESVDLNGDGFADGVLSTWADDSNGTIEFKFRFMNGTSMASPHMAGVVALMKSVNPGLTPAQFDAMLAAGDLTEDLGVAGRDDKFGYGLIDAFKAVKAARDAAPDGPVPPALEASPGLLNFGPTGTTLTLTLRNSGGGTLTVTDVADDADWLTVVPATVDGAGLGTYTATVSRGNLPAGAYSATLSIKTGGVTTNIPVRMQVGPGTTTKGDAGQHYVLLIDPATFRTVRTVSVAPGAGVYSFAFTDVAPGDYFIYAGSDIDNDDKVCDGGEACGGYPVLSKAEIVKVGTEAVSGLDFSSSFQIDISPTVSGVHSQRALSRIEGGAAP
ncbi:MAG: S8 family serine peptidase [Gammaproteobacteria bacterium]|nr:S8 family serine peptidase [Gammaproteobacteria bacterium]